MKKKLLLTLLGATGIIAPTAMIAPAMVTEGVQFSKERNAEDVIVKINNLTELGAIVGDVSSLEMRAQETQRVFQTGNGWHGEGYGFYASFREEGHTTEARDIISIVDGFDAGQFFIYNLAQNSYSSFRNQYNAISNKHISVHAQKTFETISFTIEYNQTRNSFSFFASEEFNDSVGLPAGGGVYITDQQEDDQHSDYGKILTSTDTPSYFELSDNISIPGSWSTRAIESINENGDSLSRIFLENIVAGYEEGTFSKFTINIFKKEGDLLIDEIILESPLPLSDSTHTPWISLESGTEYYYTITTDAIVKNVELEGVKNNFATSTKPDFGTLETTELTHNSAGVAMNNFINGTGDLRVLAMKLVSNELDGYNESNKIENPNTGNQNFTISGLGNNKAYSFRLKVLYNGDPSFMDSGITIDFKTGILGSPVYGNLDEIETTTSSTKIKLSSFYNGTEDQIVDGLKLVSGEKESEIIENLSGEFTFNVPNLERETEYTFELFHRNAATGLFSATGKTITITTSKEADPIYGELSETESTYNSTKINLSSFTNGEASKEVNGLKLISAEKESETIEVLTGELIFNASNLNPETEYTFELHARNAATGLFSATGKTITITTSKEADPVYGELSETETTYNSTKISLSSFTNGEGSKEVNGLKLVSGENSSNIIDNLSSGTYNFEALKLNPETNYTFTLMARSSSTKEWFNTTKIIDITTDIGGTEASYGELVFKDNKQFTLNNFVNGTLDKRLINIRLVATSSAREIIYSNIISDPQSGNIDFSIPNLVGGQSYTVAIEFQTESQTEWQNTNIGITEPINIPQESKKSGLSTGALIGIIIGSILAVTVIGLIIWYYKDPKFKSKVKKAFNKSDDEEQDNSDEEINNADKSSDNKVDVETKSEEINDDAKPKIADSLAKSLENINKDKNNNKINPDKEIPLNKSEFK